MARLLQETEQIVWAEPHAGSVGHGVEVNMIMVSLHQVLVQDEPNTVVLIEEQSESCSTSLPHLRPEKSLFKTKTLRNRRIFKKCENGD